MSLSLKEAQVLTRCSRPKTIPLVMTLVGDPVPRFVASLAKPGGNITGLTQVSPQLGGKRVEALKESFPRILA